MCVCYAYIWMRLLRFIRSFKIVVVTSYVFIFCCEWVSECFGSSVRLCCVSEYVQKLVQIRILFNYCTFALCFDASAIPCATDFFFAGSRIFHKFLQISLRSFPTITQSSHSLRPFIPISLFSTHSIRFWLPSDRMATNGILIIYLCRKDNKIFVLNPLLF